MRTINNFLQIFFDAVTQFKENLPISLYFLAILFGIHILNFILKYRLNILGIQPRAEWGFIGIPFSPFLHGNFSHLIFNAIPLFIFSNFILLQGANLFYIVTAIIILISGLLIWLFARPGIHIGASSLIMGYFGFIVIDIYLKPTALSIVIGLVALFYFGGMFSNLFPDRDKQISWEGHVFGFVAGIITAWICM
ncbi:MAG: rhomboid family transporter protein [uncultured bacterium]|nr:MAG: rhomboid family transporter protein [uncultured bacterium]